MQSCRQSRPDRTAESSRRPRPGRPFLVLAAILVLLAVAGCGTAAPSAAAGPTVTDAWVRPPMGPDRPAGGYLTIVGGAQADALLGATSPIAASVELHETVADASGMAAMHPVSRLDVPAGGTVKLEPGGYHLMLMDPTGTLEVGATVEITLRFETAGEVTIQAEIRQG